MRPPSLALALLGLLAATAAWSAPRIPSVVPPDRVRAGGWYETAIPKLPVAVEELELFLLPEDGSGRLLRLTPEREVHEGVLRWRMPRIRARSARLVLRAGGRFGETESEPSAAFTVVDPVAHRPAEVLRGTDELTWHFGEPAAGAPALSSPGEPTVQAASRACGSAEGQEDSLAGPSAAGSPVWAAIEPETPPLRVAPGLSRRPPRVPMRN